MTDVDKNLRESLGEEEKWKEPEPVVKYNSNGWMVSIAFWTFLIILIILILPLYFVPILAGGFILGPVIILGQSIVSTFFLGIPFLLIINFLN